METRYSPTRQDVQRYRALRAIGMELNHKIVKTLPGRAFDEIGDALGIRRDGVLIFDNEDMTSVMMDCCIYDWYEDGKNPVQKYAAMHPAKPGTDESVLLDAFLRARYGLVVTESVVAGAGVYCKDVLNGGEFFLMDVGLSQSIDGPNAGLATRIVPMGEYWMTSGAGLPIASRDAVHDALRGFKSGPRGIDAPPGALPLAIVRACLDSGAAGFIAYEAAEATPKKGPRMPRWPGFKRRH